MSNGLQALVLLSLEQPLWQLPAEWLWKPQLCVVLDVRARTLRVVDNGHALCAPSIKAWGQLGASHNKEMFQQVLNKCSKNDRDFLNSYFATMFSCFGVGSKGVLHCGHAACCAETSPWLLTCTPQACFPRSPTSV